jgi:hypothetical protein
LAGLPRLRDDFTPVSKNSGNEFLSLPFVFGNTIRLKAPARRPALPLLHKIRPAEMVVAKKSALQIVTANLLLEGASVFLSEQGWTTDHHAAMVARDRDEAEALEKRGQVDEAANLVVGVYRIDVEIDGDGRPEPIHYREKLRVRARPSFWPDAARSRSASPAVTGLGETTHVSL